MNLIELEMLSISFEEIVPGGSVRVTNDCMLYAIDLVMVITEKNNNDAGLILRRLTDDIFLSNKLIERKTPGKGNSKTKLVSFKNAIELIMVLPGKMAKETRAKFADVITRYLAGDASLVKELHANAASNHPVASLARQSVAQSPAEALESESRKRQREELDIQKQIEEIEDSRSNRKIKESDLQIKLMKTYQFLCPGQVMDDTARVMFKDQVLNMAMGDYGQRKRLKAAGDPQDDAVYDNKPITVSTVATQMGVILTGPEAQKVGIQLKQKYFERYQRPPTKKEQLVGGAMREVNSYTERDKELMQEVIAGFIQNKH